MHKVRAFAVRPEGFFVILAAIFGGISLFMVPPMQVPDEPSHLYEAYGLSHLQILPSKFVKDGHTNYGFRIPRSLSGAAETMKASVAGNPGVSFPKHYFRQFIGQPLNPQDSDYQPGVSLYPPVVYLPQAIGVGFGRLVQASPLIIIWLGRLTNLIAWIVILFFAIRTLPFGKWTLAILALNPLVVFLSASLSADVMTIALSFLCFSMIAAAATKKEKISYPEILALLVIVVLLALTKPVNILFAPLLFLIPRRRFGASWKYGLFCAGGVALALVLALLWNATTTSISQMVAQLQRPGLPIVPSQQLQGIVHHPLGYLHTLVTNYITVPPGYPGDSVLRSYAGTFGWFDTNLPLWGILLYASGLLVALLYQYGRGAVFSVKQKLWFLILYILLAVGNITAMYAFYTPVGASVIEGVQGRYFIPASVLLIGLFTARKKILTIREQTLLKIVMSTTIVTLCLTAFVLFKRYYS